MFLKNSFYIRVEGLIKRELGELYFVDGPAPIHPGGGEVVESQGHIWKICSENGQKEETFEERKLGLSESKMRGMGEIGLEQIRGSNPGVGRRGRARERVAILLRDM